MLNNTNFAALLYEWAAQNPRPMPWKGIKNPYFIWLSEVILQQTRVEQGLPYYLKFTTRFPTVKDLADAPADEVMKCWEGLGYYSRARNLHAAAKYVAYENEGVFPDTHEKILKMKGVGAYTAAAIASFAFDLPYAVVDGNVYRVLARIFGIETPIDSPKGQKEFQSLAQDLLDKKNAARYNQAMMDFGATHCTPKNPNCKNCIFQADCKAFLYQKIDILPVKAKKMKRRTRFFNYFVINDGKNIFLQQRKEKDIWQDLYEFPMLETTSLLEKDRLENIDFLKKNQIDAIKQSKVFKQELTHQTIIAQFFEISLKQIFLTEKDHFLAIKEENLKNFAFPKIIDLYVSEKNVTLTLF
jgi:A/G-specific adenine glycosylase